MRFWTQTIVKSVLMAALLIAALATPCLSGEIHITVLLSHDTPPYSRALEGFQESLQKKSINARYTVVSLKGDADRAREALRTIKEEGCDLIYALGSLAATTVIGEVPDIPIVSALTYSANIHKKADNATGVVLEIPVETQLSMLQRVLPDVKTVGVLYNPGENQALIDRASQIAWKKNLHLSYWRVDSPKDIPGALKSVGKTADVIWGISDNVVLTPQTAKNILLYSYRNKIPFVGLSAQWVKSGALYSLERDYRDMGRQSGEIVLRILRGKKAGSIAPASPRTVQYVLSLKAARHMKIEFAQAVINQAHASY